LVTTTVWLFNTRLASIGTTVTFVNATTGSDWAAACCRPSSSATTTSPQHRRLTTAVSLMNGM
jgi:hypothetical protein